MIAPPAPVLAVLLENVELLTATEPHSLPMAPPYGAEFPVIESSVTVTVPPAQLSIAPLSVVAELLENVSPVSVRRPSRGWPTRARV